MNWREALVDAFGAVPAAYERRREITEAAHGAGLTYAEIAKTVGYSAAGVHKIVGTKRAANPQMVLDAADFEGWPG